MNADLTKLRNDLQVRAVDGDAPGSKNSDVRYEILTGNYDRKFAIDSVTGVISVKEPLLDEEGIEKRRRRGRSGEPQSRDNGGGARAQSCLLIECRCEFVSYFRSYRRRRGARDHPHSPRLRPRHTVAVRRDSVGRRHLLHDLSFSDDEVQVYIFTDEIFTRSMRFIIPEPPDEVDKEKDKIRLVEEYIPRVR